MAHDTKYGKVTTEFGNLGEDEPVVVFRARDVLLQDVLSFYRQKCAQIGSPQKHLDLIHTTEEKVYSWQERNKDKVRVPTSASYKEHG